MREKVLYWTGISNHFILIIAISLFYLFKRLRIKSVFINEISSLSLYIYLIHENVLIRQYTRLYIWHYLYEKIGYEYLFIEIIGFSIALFLISIICSYIYKMTIEKIVNRVVEKIGNSKKMRQRYLCLENKILKIK